MLRWSGLRPGDTHLHDTPEPARVRLADQTYHGLAAREKDRQRCEIGVDIALINARLCTATNRLCVKWEVQVWRMMEEYCLRNVYLVEP